MDESPMVEVELGRIVIQDGLDSQFIYLRERERRRGFPIVIGRYEAEEIQRVVVNAEPRRPLTHQLLHNVVRALGASIQRVDIVDLRENTFFARVVLSSGKGDVIPVVDARPSDAIALALRAHCPIRVSESVFRLACAEPGAQPGPGGEPSGGASPEEPGGGASPS
jgi:bifunctional DNase/RNase